MKLDQQLQQYACSVFVASVVDALNRLYYVGVAKTRVRVTPRVGVGVRVRVCLKVRVRVSLRRG